MKLFVDENLPAALAHGLDALFAGEHQVVALRDKFDRPGVQDAEWIETLGSEGGWTVLSGDMQIARRRPSRELFLRARLVGFFPLPAVMKLPVHRKAARILTLWPIMLQIAGGTDSALFELGISGNKLRQING